MNELSRRIGKFDSPESLLKAYNALESEFTKRSQRLKETESKIGELTDMLSDDARLRSRAKELLNDKGFVDENILGNDAIKDKVIESYLNKLRSNPSVSLLKGGTGVAALTPPAMPKSLSEAKKLADIILNA